MIKEKKLLLKKIEMSLDTMRSYLKEDGGNIEVIELSDENILLLKFMGNCTDCSQVRMTSASIEQAIMNYIPEIKKVNFVTN